MPHFTKEQMQEARITDLFEFLMINHESEFKLENNSLRLIDNHSVSIRCGFTGYMDFATGETGNSVDFLTRYLGYSVDEAVFALVGDFGYVSPSSRPLVPVLVSKDEPQRREKQDFVLPTPVQGPYKNLYAYLKKRGISQETIQALVDKQLIYQESGHNNIVFVNKDKDWGEVRGTYDLGNSSFHGMITNGRQDGYWCFSMCDEIPSIAYVCEASIDAISLYELHRLKGKTDPAYYVSIGGAAKQSAIDRIKRLYRTIMAVDNDEAGSGCRKRNPELESIIPIKKDWNDDLLDVRSGNQAPSERQEE